MTGVVTNFVANTLARADQINAAFLQAFPAAGVSPFSETVLSKTSASQWRVSLGAVAAPAAANDNEVALFDAAAGAVKSSGEVWGNVARKNIAQIWGAAQTFTGGALVPSQTIGAGDANAANTKYVYDFFNSLWGVSIAKVDSQAFTGNPTAPTPATNDNDTSLATTAFVKSVLGNFAGFIFASANITLTSADYGKAVQAASASPFNVTLPLGGGWGSLVAGPVVTVFNHGTANVTIIRQGSDFIYCPPAGLNAGNTSLTLKPGQDVILLDRGGTEWDVAGGSWLVANTQVVPSTAITGLGTAATQNTGTAAGQIPLLDGSARLPAVDGSQLTNVNAASVPVRQTVLSGPASNGLPNFLPATSGSLSLTSQNVSTGTNALIATAASGFSLSGQANVIGQATSNLTWSSLAASSTVYLGVTISGNTLTPFSTTLQPIYQYGGAISVTNGQYTFDIVAMRMYLGNGSVANPVNAVFVGEVVTGSSSVTSTIAYAYQGFYQYDSPGAYPATSTANTFNHNLGTNVGVIGTLQALCVTSEGGFLAGEVITPASGSTSSSASQFQSLGIGRNIARFATPNSSSLYLVNASTSAMFAATLANWRLRLLVRRGW